MAKYKKLPVVIDAWQWHKHGDHEKVIALSVSLGWIETLEGGHRVSPGDWIIKGIKGEFYPCKPDIFEMTYEIVKEESKNIWPYYKCPKCGSFNIGQNRSPKGKMWCVDCGYYTDKKEVKPNQFVVAFQRAVMNGEDIPKMGDKNQ